jgi:hypothetical protein
MAELPYIPLPLSPYAIDIIKNNKKIGEIIKNNYDSINNYTGGQDTVLPSTPTQDIVVTEPSPNNGIWSRGFDVNNIPSSNPNPIVNNNYKSFLGDLSSTSTPNPMPPIPPAQPSDVLPSTPLPKMPGNPVDNTDTGDGSMDTGGSSLGDMGATKAYTATAKEFSMPSGVNADDVEPIIVQPGQKVKLKNGYADLLYDKKTKKYKLQTEAAPGSKSFTDSATEHWSKVAPESLEDRTWTKDQWEYMQEANQLARDSYAKNLAIAENNNKNQADRYAYSQGVMPVSGIPATLLSPWLQAGNMQVDVRNPFSANIGTNKPDFLPQYKPHEELTPPALPSLTTLQFSKGFTKKEAATNPGTRDREIKYATPMITMFDVEGKHINDRYGSSKASIASTQLAHNITTSTPGSSKSAIQSNWKNFLKDPNKGNEIVDGFSKYLSDNKINITAGNLEFSTDGNSRYKFNLPSIPGIDLTSQIKDMYKTNANFENNAGYTLRRAWNEYIKSSGKNTSKYALDEDYISSAGKYNKKLMLELIGENAISQIMTSSLDKYNIKW